MSRYARIVKKEDIDYNGGTATISNAKATEYTNLRRISLPYGNGHGDWTETIVLTHMNGTQEKVRGHLVETGGEE